VSDFDGLIVVKTALAYSSNQTNRPLLLMHNVSSTAVEKP